MAVRNGLNDFNGIIGLADLGGPCDMGDLSGLGVMVVRMVSVVKMG